MEARGRKPRQLTPGQSAARRAAIANLRLYFGWTLQQIGDHYGFSRQRAHQLLQRWRSETEEAPNG